MCEGEMGWICRENGTEQVMGGQSSACDMPSSLVTSFTASWWVGATGRCG